MPRTDEKKAISASLFAVVTSTISLKVDLFLEKTFANMNICFLVKKIVFLLVSVSARKGNQWVTLSLPHEDLRCLPDTKTPTCNILHLFQMLYLTLFCMYSCSFFSKAMLRATGREEHFNNANLRTFEEL